MQHFPFPASREKGTLQWNAKVYDTKRCMTPGAFKLDHLQATKPFLQNEFPLNQQAKCSISLLLHPEKRAPYNELQKCMITRGV